MSDLDKRLMTLQTKIGNLRSQMYLENVNFDDLVDLIDNPDLADSLKEELTLYVKELYQVRLNSLTVKHAKEFQALAQKHKEESEALQKYLR